MVMSASTFISSVTPIADFVVLPQVHVLAGDTGTLKYSTEETVEDPDHASMSLSTTPNSKNMLSGDMFTKTENSIQRWKKTDIERRRFSNIQERRKDIKTCRHAYWRISAC